MPGLGHETTRWGDLSHVRYRLRKRTIEPVAAEHNDLFVGNVSFGIRKRTFATAALNGCFGSILAVREGRLSAKNSRSLEPLAMSAYGSESSRSDNMHHTSAGDPKATLELSVFALLCDR